MQSPKEKARQVDEQGGLMDLPIFEGQVVHPQDINAIQRIVAEDGRVIEDLERESELPSSEFLLQTLKAALSQGLRGQIEALPDGIHSGKRAPRHGIFFHIRAGDRHFWRFWTTARLLQRHHLGGTMALNAYQGLCFQWNRNGAMAMLHLQSLGRLDRRVEHQADQGIPVGPLQPERAQDQG